MDAYGGKFHPPSSIMDPTNKHYYLRLLPPRLCSTFTLSTSIAHRPPKPSVAALSQNRSRRPWPSSINTIWCTIERTDCFSASTTKSALDGAS